MATKTKLSKAVLAILMACALAAMAALAACSSPQASSSSSSSSQVMSASDTTQSTATAKKASGVYNLLVLGNDKWEQTTPGHPDLICIMRVDLDNHKITQLTVPRDTRVTGADGNPNKLMVEMTGKPYDEQVKLVEGVTGMKIDYYAEIWFEGLETIVDGFGGVPMDLPYSCLYHFYTNDYPDEQFEAGEQTLNGFQAMEISRARTGYSAQDLDGADMIRQFVDRQMFRSLMQLAYTGGVDNAANIVTKYQDLIKTNLSLEDQVAWIKKLGETGSIQVVGTTGPFDGAIPDDADFWLVTPDPEGWSAIVDAVETGGDLQVAIDSYAYHEFNDKTPAVTETTIKVG